MNSILFICLGNICRSPIAEGIARDIAIKNNLELKIDSAGTSGWHEGEAPCENSISVSKNNDIDISKQRSRQIRSSDKTVFKYIVVMDQNNYAELQKSGYKNLYKIGNYGDLKGICIPDPYFYQGFEGFDKVFDMLNIAINDFFITEGLLK
jgi:protein-tyrosine phosphatase